METTKKTGKEEMGVILNDGVLVLPDYKNTSNGVNLSDYNYSTENGNLKDANGKIFNTIATVHTHPGGGEPSWKYSGDLGFTVNSTPFKPVYVLQMNGVNKISYIIADNNPTKKYINTNAILYNLTNYYKDANPANLMNGRFSLIKYTKSNNFIRILQENKK